VIEKVILNSPFEEPTRHFRVVGGSFTEEIVRGRRQSSYVIPVAKPRGSIEQLRLDTAGADTVQENQFINEVRALVGAWRDEGHLGCTATTRALLDYWTDSHRENRLFFAQIEAIETAIFLAEYVPKHRPHILNYLDKLNQQENASLPRRAIKMATGTGKTVVMGMLIAWQTLNKVANSKDKRFRDTFLIVTPGVTIKDRLRVLKPDEINNYYQARDLVPPDMRQALPAARIAITNFHSFMLRDTVDAARRTKAILGGGVRETPGAMVTRVLRELGNRKEIIVLNDEAHHCYMARETDATSGEEAKAARVWISGLIAVAEKVGIRAVYDLSATPFYLSSSGREEETLFEWVVSDFDLTDAIESGLVKIPHTPVSDDTASEIPKYRHIWKHIQSEMKLLKAARGPAELSAPVLPATLEGALKSLYGDYERTFRAHLEGNSVPPVFVIVCDDTRSSKLVADWIAGYDGFDGPANGHLELFANVKDGRWLERPRTLLIDSNQLESGNPLSETFKVAAKREIDDFRAAYTKRTGATVVDDATVLREVLNTVGKRGQLGEHIRCVVSVQMLSEGWDVNAVTHILGARRFSTKLLCEQVIGRGLRRMTYDLVSTEDGDRLPPEYAEIYGIPFDFSPIKVGGGLATTRPRTIVEALVERATLEIRFPLVAGYFHITRPQRLSYKWPPSRFIVSPKRFHIALTTEMRAFVGDGKVINLDLSKRLQTIAFDLAATIVERHFTTEEGQEQYWYFPQVLEIARKWLDDQVFYEDGGIAQLFEIEQVRNAAVEEIVASIERGEGERTELRPQERSFSPEGSTTSVWFETVKPVVPTQRSHVSGVACDSSWEGPVAKILEDVPEVTSYVKNQGLNFTIPYVFEGKKHPYYPDFIVKWRLKDGQTLNIILEVSGADDEEKRVKCDTAKNLWVPAVNNSGKWGTWAFAETTSINATYAALQNAVDKFLNTDSGKVRR
jgi:type III restriction enzyme